MGEFFKELFRGVGLIVRTPQVLGYIAMVLMIYKHILRTEFTNLMLILVTGLGKFGFLINIFQLTSVMLLLTSLITFILGLYFSIHYLIIEAYSEKRNTLSHKFIEHSDTMHRFFIGTKLAIVKVNIWMIVSWFYFYIFDEASFMKYVRIIWEYIVQRNGIVQFLLLLFGVTVLFSSLALIKKVAYKFLYFRLDDETEKRLSELRGNAVY